VVNWLYVSIIRPSITFACLVWWPSCQTASTEKRLSRVQRLAFLGITGAMRTTHTGAMEALPGLLPLDLVIQDEARSAAHRLWSMGCWSYLQLCQGHSNVLMGLQRSDRIFNMRIHVIRPDFNLEPKYRVTMLTREERTRGPEEERTRGPELLLYSKGSSGSRIGRG
jgi:hypothetical protein